MGGIRGFLESSGLRERSDEVPGEGTVGLFWSHPRRVARKAFSGQLI